MAREAWTHERLDDLNGRIGDGFREGREEIRTVRGEIQALRSEVCTEFRAVRGEMNVGFARVDSRIDRLQLAMVASLLTALCTLVVTIAGFVVTNL